MLSWLTRTAQSSIGKKALMSLTGLALIGFLIVHLAGNLTYFADSSGETFDHYAETIESNPLLPLAEGGLIVLFLLHIALAFKVTLQNKAARQNRYAVKASHGGRTTGSRTMIVTGIVILGFLILHLIHFRLQKDSIDSFAAAIKMELSKPLGAGAYVVGILALGIHLSHGFKSAFQTLGLNHPKYTPLIEKLGLLIAVVLTLGFLSFPILIFLGGKA
jgi:succinate dehydrogenase / fumarate reductase, cytochrome b subunit